MSIQNENDVILEGRRNRLGEEADAPLREKPVKRLLNILEEDKVGLMITRAWDTETSNIGEQLSRQQAFLDNVDNFRDCPEGSNPFGGSSSLHLPVAFTTVKAYQARFFDALFSVDPPFVVKARREDTTDSVQVLEDLIKFAILSMANRGEGIKPAMDIFVWNWAGCGTAIMKTRWLTEYERYTKVSKQYLPLPPIKEFDAAGSLIEVPQWEVLEKEEDVTEKIQSCPQADFVNIEDFRMIGGDGNVDAADMLLHRSYMNLSALWTGVDRGLYQEDVVEEIAKRISDDVLQPGDQTGTIKQMRRLKAGDHSFTTENRRTECEVIEACLKYDVDGSGITTEIVVLVEKRTSKILSANYLRRMSSSGKRPYAVAYFHRRPGENFGIGLLEILAPLTTQLDMMHNIRVDNALFESTPFYTYKKRAGVERESIVLEPGMGIPVVEHDDIFFPQLPNRTAFTMQEEQNIHSYIERVTGISDLSLGVVSSTQGVTRTAAGVRAVMGENNSNLSIHLHRLSQAWTRILQNIHALLRDNIEDGFTFRVIGDDGKDVFHRVDQLHLGIDIDFEVSANSAHSNKAVQVEMGQLLYQLTGNPMDIQMGIVSVDNRYAAIKTYLNALGVKDVHRYISRPQSYAYIVSPQEEFMRVIRGQEVPILPQQDHAGFLAFAQSMIQATQDPETGVTLSNEQKDALTQQMRLHQEMMQALQQQAAQQANVAQMQTNASSSVQGTPATYSNQANNYGQVF